MSWFRKIAWGKDKLMDNIIAAFSFDSRVQSHRMGKMLPFQQYQDFKYFQDSNDLVKIQMRFYNERQSDRNIEVLITIAFSKTIQCHIDLFERKLIEDTPQNEAINFGSDVARPSKVAEEDMMSWNKIQLKDVPRDVINTTYRLIDEHFGFDGGEDEDVPDVPIKPERVSTMGPVV